MKRSFGIPTLATIFLASVIGTTVSSEYYFSAHPVHQRNQYVGAKKEISGKVLRVSRSGNYHSDNLNEIIITLDSDRKRIPVYIYSYSEATTSRMSRTLGLKSGACRVLEHAQELFLCKLPTLVREKVKTILDILNLINRQAETNSQVRLSGSFQESGIFEADGTVIQERLMSFEKRR